MSACASTRSSCRCSSGGAARDLRRDGRGPGPRRALAEHQGAAGLLDGAVRRRRRARHAGRAHPGPPRLDARRGRGGRGARGSRADGAGDLWILNDPFRGGTHLPDITLVSPLVVDGRADRLGGQPRPPRRRRRADAGRDARRLAPARRRGRGDRAAARSTRRGWPELAGADAQTRRSGSPTCGPSAPPTCSAAGRVAELAERHRARPAARRAWRRCSTTPSAAAGRAIARARRRHLRGRATRSRPPTAPRSRCG